MGDAMALQRALDAVDAANADDPSAVEVDGRAVPKALGQGRRASDWVRRLRPGASDALVVAARAHHVRRWELPRSSFPDGRAGYLRWRREQHERHAALLADLLRASGWAPETVGRAQDIVRKRGLGHDDEVQVYEDAVCLTFIETELDDMVRRTPRAEMARIVEKTLAKMSARGRDAALGLPGVADRLAALGVAADPPSSERAPDG